MKVVRRKGPITRRSRNHTVSRAPVIQDLSPQGILDRLGRRVAMPVPCWGCRHAERTGNVVRCRAGITKLADIGTQSQEDPDAHGWAESPNVRPMSEKDYRMGHRGTYQLTLETVLMGGLDRPLFREVVARHVAAAWSEDGVVSSEERARVAADVRAEISRHEYLDESVLEELECLVRRLLGSDDILDHPDRLVDHEGIERFGKSYDPLDKPVDRPTRDARVEKENFSPPSAHYLVETGNVFEPEVAPTFNRWGYRNPGWVQTRRFLKNLPIPDGHFVPHPEPGVLSERNRAFALRNVLLCPLANNAPDALNSLGGVCRELLRVKDPEILRALWRCLTPDLRERALKSSKVPEEVKTCVRQ